MHICNHNKLKTVKNIWIDKQSQIKWSDEKTHPHLEINLPAAQTSPVTHIKQLQGKLKLFDISNR